MPKKIQWDSEAWESYLYWQETDKRILKRLNLLIKDISRNPFDGIGKPEPLKGDLSGFWSRRIDGKNRIIYCEQEDIIYIISCRGHYSFQ